MKEQTKTAVITASGSGGTTTANSTANEQTSEISELNRGTSAVPNSWNVTSPGKLDEKVEGESVADHYGDVGEVSDGTRKLEMEETEVDDAKLDETVDSQAKISTGEHVLTRQSTTATITSLDEGFETDAHTSSATIDNSKELTTKTAALRAASLPREAPESGATGNVGANETSTATNASTVTAVAQTTTACSNSAAIATTTAVAETSESENSSTARPWSSQQPEVQYPSNIGEFFRNVYFSSEENF